MRHPATRSATRRPGLLVVVALAVAFAGGCSGDPAPTKVPAEQVRDGGTLRLAVAELPLTLNPYRAEPLSNVEHILAPTRGDAIKVAADGSWEVDPLYAEAVEIVSTDPLKVSVRLNPKGVWSDGSAIDTADMQAFVAAQRGTGGQQTTSTEWSVVSGVVPGADAYSYTVEFTEPTADWPAFVYPGLPAESTPAEVYNGFVDNAPLSNGPFMVSSVDRTVGTMSLERNPAWWGPSPHLDGINLSVAASTQQAEAFTSGDLDAVAVDEGTVGAVEGTGTLIRAAGTEWSQVTLNAGTGPLVNPQVRRAVALAIDRDEVVKDRAEATGAKPEKVGSLVLLPGQADYRDTVSGALPFDQQESRRLLQEAGYVLDADGRAVGTDGTQLTLDLPVPAGTLGNQRRAELLRDMLAKVGIAVAIREVPAQDFFPTVVVALDFDLVTFVWLNPTFGIAEATGRYFPIDARENFTGQQDPQVGDLAAQVRRTVDPPARAELIAAYDAAVLATAATVPLVLEPQLLAVADDVVNLAPTQFGDLDWTAVGFRE